jgi:hypothetical protein
MADYTLSDYFLDVTQLYKPDEKQMVLQTRTLIDEAHPVASYNTLARTMNQLLSGQVLATILSEVTTFSKEHISAVVAGVDLFENPVTKELLGDSMIALIALGPKMLQIAQLYAWGRYGPLEDGMVSELREMIYAAEASTDETLPTKPLAILTHAGREDMKEGWYLNSVSPMVAAHAGVYNSLVGVRLSYREHEFETRRDFYFNWQVWEKADATPDQRVPPDVKEQAEALKNALFHLMNALNKRHSDQFLRACVTKTMASYFNDWPEFERNESEVKTA